MYAALYFHVRVRGHYYTAGYLHGLTLPCCAASELLIMVSLMRCWPGTAALGSWVLLSASDQESAEDAFHLNILMWIWIGIKQQCIETCLDGLFILRPSRRQWWRLQSSVVSFFTLTILMSISENTRVIVVKWCQRTSPGRSINYLRLYDGNHLPSCEDMMQHYSLFVPDCVDISRKWSHIYTTMLSPERAKCWVFF